MTSKAMSAGLILAALLTLTPAIAPAEPPPPGKSVGVESFGDKSEASTSSKEGATVASPVEGASDTMGAPAPKPKPKRRRKPKPKPKPPIAASAAIPAVGELTSLPITSYTDWKSLDAENTLVFETSKGPIVVELRPEFAPAAVAQIKKLVRRNIYDGLLFHRVIDGFVAQTGNPNNRDGGKSDEPNLTPEFTFRMGADTPHAVVARPVGGQLGLIGSSPYESVDEARMAMSPDHRVSAWGAFCAGVVGMGRDQAPDSANSEIFFMRDPARRLDRDYAVIGRVIQGLEVVRSMTVGEPPVHPDKILRAAVMADLPDAERPKLKILNTMGSDFRKLVDHARAVRGADFSICDIETPVKPDFGGPH